MMSAAGNVASEKRVVVVRNCHLRGNKSVPVSELCCRGPNHVRKPRSGIGFPLQAQIRAANHVGENHGFGARKFA